MFFTLGRCFGSVDPSFFYKGSWPRDRGPIGFWFPRVRGLGGADQSFYELSWPRGRGTVLKHDSGFLS